MIDRVVKNLGRPLFEVPVGFKWFVEGLIDGSLGFGGEESSGATFLRRDGTVWTTDKDGIVPNLLTAEITARTNKDPGEHYEELTAEFGIAYYTRIDAPATADQKEKLAKLAPEAVVTNELAGEPITAKLTVAPGDGAPIGGLKVTTANGWFAARPSGRITSKEFISAKEAALLLNCSERHIHNLVDRARRGISENPIPYRKVGETTTFLRTELIEWTKVRPNNQLRAVS